MKVNGHNIKIVLLASIGAIGGCVNTIIDKHNGAILSLIIFMCIDYIMGVLAACLLQKSKKTHYGGLNSSVGWRGLCKKIITLLLVLASERIDLLLGTAVIQECISYAFIGNELLSIVENAGVIGIPIPQIFVNAIEILQSKNKNHL